MSCGGTRSMRYGLLMLAITFSSLTCDATPDATLPIEEYLGTQLVSYELLQPGKLISKRSVDGNSRATEHVYFNAFKKNFHLVLRRGRALSERLQSMDIRVVKNDAHEDATSVNPFDLFADFYEGYIEGEANSRVTGYRHEDRLHLTLYEENSVILNIEPLSLLSGNQSEHRLLAFYDSNINGSSESSCGFSNPTITIGKSSTGSGANLVKDTTQPRKRRQHRSTSPEVTPTVPSYVCRQHMVADHTFINHFGSVKFALKFLIKAIDDINAIFQPTEFVTNGENTFRNIGIELGAMTALTEPAAESELPRIHFNSKPVPNKQISASVLLDAFGDEGQHGLDLHSYCLGYLATYRPLEHRTLGLAYQGNANPENPGGICSVRSRSKYRNYLVARNIAMNTYVNRDGVSLLTRQAILVLAHEIAHCFGAPHDPETGECNPRLLGYGGYFLLHAKAVNGLQPNHSKMSPCTRKAIGRVLKGRLQNCLNKTGNLARGVCGNSRVDPGEVCDAGPEGDDCCGRDCRLLQGATCSDANSPCCRSCRLAPAGTVCRRGGLPLWPCHLDAVCNGLTGDCPAVGSPVLDGTVCLGVFSVCKLGSCRGGRCEVAATGSNTSRLPGCDGSSVPVVRGGLTVRLWRLVGRSKGARHGSSFIVVLRNNMVFLTIVLSVLIWISVVIILDHMELTNRTVEYSEIG